MGNVHRFQGRLLPYPNKHTFQQIPVFSHPGSILPIHSCTVWSVHCSNGIHDSGQGSQTDSSRQGYKNPPVPRLLVGQSHFPSSSYVSGIDLESKHIELESKQNFSLIGSQYNLSEGKVRPTSDSGAFYRPLLSSHKAHVPRRPVNIYRETSSPWLGPYKIDPVAP